MSEPETFPADLHPEVALLPWFVSGTLSEADREKVARHLESCTACRAELDEMSQLKIELSTIYAAQPGPSAQTAHSVLRAVKRDALLRGLTRPVEGSWLAGVDQWLRSFLLPRWVPTLVAVALLAQVGLLLWTAMPTHQLEEITTRSVGLQTARIRVTFESTATEEQIRSLLQGVRGRVIDGPAQDGAYVIELLAADEATKKKKLETLRGQRTVIRSAEVMKP
jgi:anti-sigma factor RsiW